MIANFFLDNRIGGPHIYSKTLLKDINDDYFNVTCGKSKFSKIHLSNLKRKNKYLFLIEIFINVIEIIRNRNFKKTSTFFVFSIYNIAPILSGVILRKKLYWFLIEDINLLSKNVFRILNFFF